MYVKGTDLGVGSKLLWKLFPGVVILYKHLTKSRERGITAHSYNTHTQSYSVLFLIFYYPHIHISAFVLCFWAKDFWLLQQTEISQYNIWSAAWWCTYKCQKALWLCLKMWSHGVLPVSIWKLVCTVIHSDNCLLVIDARQHVDDWGVGDDKVQVVLGEVKIYSLKWILTTDSCKRISASFAFLSCLQESYLLG